jgi:antitoxin (DNA-binding transcriptional repressor) of toxin-antitoxin stability system
VVYSISETQKRLCEFAELVYQCGMEIVITRKGEPIARLTRLSPEQQPEEQESKHEG